MLWSFCVQGDSENSLNCILVTPESITSLSCQNKKFTTLRLLKRKRGKSTSNLCLEINSLLAGLAVTHSQMCPAAVLLSPWGLFYQLFLKSFLLLQISIQGIKCHYDILPQSIFIIFFYVLPGMMAHALNLSTWMAGAGGSL